MKYLLIVLILFPAIGIGQIINSTTKRNSSNIYNDAIKHYNPSKMDTLFFMDESSDSITDSLLTRINGKTVVIADSVMIEKQLKRKQSFILHRIFPMEYDNKVFTISIIPYNVLKSANGIELENGGGYLVTYGFDSKKNKFRFIKSLKWGL